MKEISVDDLNLVYDPLPSGALTDFISKNVINTNFARTGVSTWHPVGFFLRNKRGEVLGGVTGHVWAGWIHINYLWVTEMLRGQRNGTRLMDAAESFAVERGAANATLETMSYQAPGFYRKRGYVVFGQLDDYPTGHTKFYLRKNLAQP
jgi:ribosomal protein S18 acetylase RimI-like enzyme